MFTAALRSAIRCGAARGCGELAPELCQPFASALTCAALVEMRSRRPLAMVLRALALCRGIGAALLAAFAAVALPAAAHHSLAPYDVEQSIHFDGIVETLRLENPRIALTLAVTKDDGMRGTINFAEGAPAGRIARMGLTSSDLAVGKPIKAIGAPHRDDPNLYYLKAIILPDGRRFTFAD
jgi:hypothetical protein